ncbi:hypothetical protein TWF730_008997 [Orbilia blumenaviensis]|uniref:Uncharacterized protein n=1 Tax=Orbilia blumenaviensis TaxID=1796055 RepID=A0AAV9UZD9_9PEZI
MAAAELRVRVLEVTDEWGNSILPVDKHGFAQVMCNEYLCNMILDYLDHPPTLWSLVNVNRRVRHSLLTDHFHRYRRVVVMRPFMPSHWPTPHPTNWTLRDEKHKRRMIESGRWPKNTKYFDRFTDFNLEELIINKLLRIPFWVAPTMDTGYFKKMDDLGIYITSLTLDGTAVTGRGLFGAVAQPMCNDVYRTSPGLVSYVASHLEYLSIKNCPNIQHSDIAIYLLLPPSDHNQLSKLRSIRCFNCGEAPTYGPFQNLPGYGSKNLVVQKSDNILNIQILSLLFPYIIPVRHHRQVSLPLCLPITDPAGLIREDAYTRFDNLYKAGWFNSEILTRFPPPVTLPLPLHSAPNNISSKLKNPLPVSVDVPGPYGGFISSMNESLMLKSICFFRNIKSDWVLCCMGRYCVTFTQNSFAPVAKINSRTGRTVQVGNIYGAIIGGKLRRKDYFNVVDGIKPRVPVALSGLIPETHGTNLNVNHNGFPARTSFQPTEEHFTHAPNNPPKQGHPDAVKRFRPRFLSLAGMVPGPDYEDPKGEGDKTYTMTGLSGEGLHSHSCAGTGHRREKGGKECVNCGLWEYENYVWTYEEEDNADVEMEDELADQREERPRKMKKVRVKDPGRRVIGELCEVCVPFFTCGDCGDFYCPSCLVPPRAGDRPNPWATRAPSPNLMRHPCTIHGGTCEVCFLAYRPECQKCRKYVCIECVNETLEDSYWKRCTVCTQFVCKDCATVTKPNQAPEILICKENFGEYGLGHEFCLNCLGGICRYCEEAWCSTCFKDKRDRFMKEHGVTMTKDKFSCFTCQTCFEHQLAWAKTELERVEVWKFVGVNILYREMKQLKERELEYAIDADFQKETRESPWGKWSAPIEPSRPGFANKAARPVTPEVNPNENESDDSDKRSCSSSSGYSSSSTTLGKSGENHRIIKTMDNLYAQLGNLLGRGKLTPNGTAELMKCIRMARKYILARKLAEQSYRLKREQGKQPRKHLKVPDDPELKDPVLKEREEKFETKIRERFIAKDMLAETPLRNCTREISFAEGKEGFQWVPTESEKAYWENRMNDITSEYFLTDAELARIDFAYEVEGQELGAEGEKERRRHWEKTGRGKPDWRDRYLPPGWDGEKGKGVKRQAEDSSSDEEEVVLAPRRKGRNGKEMKKSLKKLRSAMRKLDLDMKNDGKLGALGPGAVLPEEPKREVRGVGRLWALREAKRKEAEAKKKAQECTGGPTIGEGKPQTRKSRAKEKRGRGERSVSTKKGDSLVRATGDSTRNMTTGTDVTGSVPRTRGSIVRFGEATGQGPPGAVRPSPAALNQREREIYQAE